MEMTAPTKKELTAPAKGSSDANEDHSIDEAVDQKLASCVNLSNLALRILKRKVRKAHS